MSLEELEELGGFADVMESLPLELRADKAERATVASLARKLPGENVVRRTAERILRGTAGDSDHIGTVKQVVVERSGFKWRERILAAWSLGLTPARNPEEREHCLKALGNLANHSLERDNFGAFVRLQYRALILTIPYLVFIRVRGYDSYTFWDLVNTIFINLGFSLLALPVSMMLERRRMNLARAAAILSLGRMEAPEATGVVAAAVYDKVGEGSADVKKAAERSLPAVLEALTDEHYGRVRTTSIEYLCRILQDRRDHLVLAALKALGKVGGGSAAEPVAKLAKRTRSAEVKNVAERILPVLEYRRKEGLLLRAATGPAADEEILLRATKPEIETDITVLLRPTSGGAEE